jgi:ribose 5-phosphate isomerase B
MKIVIGCDHAAYEMKELVKEFLHSLNFDVIDVGTHSLDRCDYPDYAKALCHEVIHQQIEGVLLCGSGIGVSMVANRFQGIRAALCRSSLDSEMAKKHNNANVLCLGARQNTIEEIKTILESWFNNKFEEGRHTDRILKFNLLGEKI